MSTQPKVGKEQREVETDKLYAKVGKITVLGEHLNAAMSDCCRQVLEVRGLHQTYAQTVLVGQNLENMRRTWESLLKLFYAGDADANGMIDHLSNRIDNVIQRRNGTVHRLWYIGWGNDETQSYAEATGISAGRNIGKKGTGGVKYTNKDTKDFEQIIDEMEKLSSLVRRFSGCVIAIMFRPDGSFGQPRNNFHYDARGQLVDAPPPKS